MIRIGLKRETKWLDLDGGGRVKVRPRTPAIHFQAEAAAGREWRTRLGIDGPGEGEKAALPPEAEGLSRALYWKHVALLTVEDWEGFVDEVEQKVQEVKPSPARIGEVFENDALFASAFEKAVVADEVLLALEKNGSGPGPSGTSAPGQPTAGDAGTEKPIAPGGCPETGANSAPT